MKIALFGNYIFAKAVAELLLNKCELMCFCNDNCDDNKYGNGIRKYAKENNIKYIVGNKNRHIMEIKQFLPDIILEVAYKNIIPVSDLSIKVYGIHLGGLYGNDVIRGRSSLTWYKIRNIENAKVTLYNFTKNEFDVGEVIKEETFPISFDDNININLQIKCIKSLISYVLDKNFILTTNEIKKEKKQIGSYYPKAVKEVNNTYLNQNEVDLLRLAGITIIKTGNLIEQKINVCNSEEVLYKYYFSKSVENVLFLHGFASTIPNDKTKKLSCLLGNVSITTPLVKGINRIYCDGMQKYEEVYEQIEMLIESADLCNTIIVCSSISSLLLCDHFPKLLEVKGLIFVTPIFKLSANAFDDNLRKVVLYGLDDKSFSFSSPYYNNCKMSKEFLEKLKSLDLLENLRNFKNIKNKAHFIFAKDDSNIEAGLWRDKCLEENIPLNNVNVIDGKHSFSDIQQLYYLASLIKKIFKK